MNALVGRIREFRRGLAERRVVAALRRERELNEALSAARSPEDRRRLRVERTEARREATLLIRRWVELG